MSVDNSYATCIECNDPSYANFVSDFEKPLVLITNPDHNIDVTNTNSLVVNAVALERNSTYNSNWSVQKFEVFIDYVSVGSNTMDIINYNLDINTISRGTHTISFEAIDNDGDKYKTSVYVVKR